MIKFEDGRIVLEKEPTALDEFVLTFVNILDDLPVKYVIVSGYTAILLGRSRATEDVDILVENINQKTLEAIISKTETAGMWIINPGSSEELLEMMMETNIRFAVKGEGIPNIEFKFAKSDLEKFSLKNRIVVKLNDNTLMIGCLELQIAYKLYLGAEKDLEDAVHIFNTCKLILNMADLEKFLNILEITEKLRRILLGDNDEDRRYKN